LKVKLLSLFFLFYILTSYNIGYASESYDGLHVGDVIGDAVVSDISATINGVFIPSLNVQGRLVVFVKDLNNYGFDIVWDDNGKDLDINRNLSKTITPISVPIKGNGKILYSAYKVHIGDRELLTYNIDGQVAICLEDLDVLGSLTWDDKNKILGVNLENTSYDAGMSYSIRGKYIVRKKDIEGSKIINYSIASFYDGSIVLKEITEMVWNNDKRPQLQNYNYDGVFLGSIIKNYGNYDNNGKVKSDQTNSNYEREIKYLSSQKFIDYGNMLISGIEKNRQTEYANNGYKPLKIQGKSITYNAIGVPEANVVLKNVSDKTIDAIKVRIYPYDTYDNRVYNFGGEGTFKGIAQRINIDPNYRDAYTWTLNLFDNATKFNVEVYSVHFTDGTTWE